MTNHAVSELVCLLKNGQLAKKYKVSSNYAKIKQSVLDILKREGFIKDYSVVEGKSYNTIDVILSYYNGEPVIKNIEIISKPGKRKYTGVEDIPVVNNGLGMVILSTSKGVLSDLEAKSEKVGGELLLRIF